MGERIRVITTHESSHGYAGSWVTGENEVEVGEEPVKVERGENEHIEIKRDEQTGSLVATLYYRHNIDGPWHGAKRVVVDAPQVLSLGHSSSRIEKVS